MNLTLPSRRSLPDLSLPDLSLPDLSLPDLPSLRDRTPRPSPLVAIGNGVVAGVVGTAVVTAAMALRQWISPPEQGAVESAHPDWGETPPPAEVGRRVAQDVFQRDVPPERAPVLLQAVHWTYGAASGALYGALQGTFHGRRGAMGTAFGVGVWLASHAALMPAAKLEPPLWKQPPVELAFGVANHVTFGLVVASTYEALERRT